MALLPILALAETCAVDALLALAALHELLIYLIFSLPAEGTPLGYVVRYRFSHLLLLPRQLALQALLLFQILLHELLKFLIYAGAPYGSRL